MVPDQEPDPRRRDGGQHRGYGEAHLPWRVRVASSQIGLDKIDKFRSTLAADRMYALE
jgi:hypothetical protein